MAAAKQKAVPKPAAGPPKVHEATLAPGPSGVVFKGAEIDVPTAVARRKAGRDIVVCGDDVDANRAVAQAIEAAVGPWMRQDPHRNAGPYSLPHFQQVRPPPVGHSFYETGSPQRK